MNVLTYDGFWKPLKKQFPVEYDNLTIWMEKYKETNEWQKLFNFGSPHYAKMGWHNPKFYDLPDAMQIGLFIQYASECDEISAVTLPITAISSPVDFKNIPNYIVVFFTNSSLYRKEEEKNIKDYENSKKND